MLVRKDDGLCALVSSSLDSTLATCFFDGAALEHEYAREVGVGESARDEQEHFMLARRGPHSRAVLSAGS